MGRIGYGSRLEPARLKRGPMNSRVHLKEDECWALVERRAEVEGEPFVYAVKSTGIYCRPGCPARRPLRRNVEFFSSSSEAEDAGYRACRRCLPGGLRGASSAERSIVEACRLIEGSASAPDLRTMAALVGLSPHYFHRLFKEKMGVTPQEYYSAFRRERVAAALKSSATVTEAIYEAGFQSSGRFYSAAPALLGMAPTVFRRGGEGLSIRFACGQTSLGAIVVAATDRGVCCVLLGDDPEKLVEQLQDRFFNATFVGDSAEFETVVAQVIQLVEQPHRAPDFPLDLLGTAFQQRVWNALSKIPPGTTVTYTELAQKLEPKSGARAVARACAQNTVAVAVPCHRVVRRDGSLSGYRWGVERKRELLSREKIR